MIATRRRLRIATYNVHSCIGLDGRCDPDRIARVIEELDADVVALQELAYPADVAIETRDPVVLTNLVGYECALGPTHTRKERHFGNVVLTRLPMRGIARIDLSTSRREPRGALHATVDAFGTDLHVIATHLGLAVGERRSQVNRIVERVSELSASFLAVLGDFNDWVPGSSLVRRLDELLGPSDAPRSFPSRYPIMALDRVWIHPHRLVRSVTAHRSDLARRASDHLPVVAELDLEFPG